MTVVIVMMIVRATWWPICLAQCTRLDPTNQKGDTLISKHTTHDHGHHDRGNSQATTGSGNDILRQLCSGEGGEEEISGGAK